MAEVDTMFGLKTNLSEIRKLTKKDVITPKTYIPSKTRERVLSPVNNNIKT